VFVASAAATIDSSGVSGISWMSGSSPTTFTLGTFASCSANAGLLDLTEIAPICGSASEMVPPASATISSTSRGRPLG
jgi:hypothetical protein